MTAPSAVAAKIASSSVVKSLGTWMYVSVPLGVQSKEPSPSASTQAWLMQLLPASLKGPVI